MENFLVNMAVVKVNWDKSQKDLLDNYIPLVAYALKGYKHDVISLDAFNGYSGHVAHLFRACRPPTKARERWTGSLYS